MVGILMYFDKLFYLQVIFIKEQYFYQNDVSWFQDKSIIQQKTFLYLNNAHKISNYYCKIIIFLIRFSMKFYGSLNLQEIQLCIYTTVFLNTEQMKHCINLYAEVNTVLLFTVIIFSLFYGL